MKSKLVLLCLSFFLSIINGISQVTVNFTQANYTSLSTNDIWNFIITNSDASGRDVNVIIELTTQANDPILNVSSLNFTISPGIYSDFSMIRLQSTYDYATSPAAQNFQSIGTLSAGDYILCVRVFNANETGMVAEDCQSFQLSMIFPFYLISPADNDTIHTLQPLLTWIPLGGNPPNLTYHLKLAEILENQSPEEAITSNLLLIDLGSLNDNSLSYPGTSPSLEYGKEYSWQVQALSNQVVVAVTDVWKFSIVSDTSIQDNTKDCYREIAPKMNTDVYLFKDMIKISFDNRSHGDSLKYKIINLSNGQSVNCSHVVTLHGGINKIDIPVSNCSLSSNTSYLLRIVDRRHKVFQLSFMVK